MRGLRRKLIVFFHGRQCGPAANDLTDRAFSIFQRKLEQRPEDTLRSSRTATVWHCKAPGLGV